MIRPAYINPIQIPTRIREIFDQGPPVHRSSGVNIKASDSTFASFGALHNSNLPTPPSSKPQTPNKQFSFSFRHSNSISGSNTDRSYDRDSSKESHVMQKTDKPVRAVGKN
jgi:hypothetical protein